jgi:alkaline phosphatase D
VCSVSSPGFETYLGFIKPADLASALVSSNAQLKWADTSQRGYMAVELTPGSAVTEYRFTGSVKQRSAKLAGTKMISTDKGSGKLAV